MPEKMTEEEARISRAIRLVRKAKETIKLVGSSTEIPYDDEVEDVKVKRPKAEKHDEDKNQKKEGYGMGGETIGKAVDPNDEVMILKRTVQNIKNIDTITALKWLKKADKTKLTPAQVKTIEREVAKLVKLDKEFIVTKIGLSNALGIPYGDNLDPKK